MGYNKRDSYKEGGVILKSKGLTRFLFIFYFVSLIWILLLKVPFTWDDVLQSLGTMRSLNLHPFGASGVINNRIDVGEIVYNAIVFIPFGVFMVMLHPKRSFLGQLLPVFLTSFLIEALQYILAIGATDITDLIMNSFGGLLGIGFFTLLRKKLKSRAYLFINGLFLGGAIGAVLIIIMVYRANLA